MLILALDTSTLVSSVALVEPGKVIAELNQETRLTHSEMLMPHIEDVLKRAEKTVQDISAIAVSIGPGSFTGLRIGLATAKTMAYTRGVPSIGISTLESLAWNCPVEGVNLVPMLDAQKGNVYTARYRYDGTRMIESEAASVKSYNEAVADLAALGEPCRLFGERKTVRAPEELPANIRMASPHLFTARAASVALAVMDRFLRGESDDVMQLEPLYIRRAEAEVLWEKRHGKKA